MGFNSAFKGLTDLATRITVISRLTTHADPN